MSLEKFFKVLWVCELIHDFKGLKSVGYGFTRTQAGKMCLRRLK